MELIKKNFDKKVVDAISGVPKDKQFGMFIALMFSRLHITSKVVRKINLDSLLKDFEEYEMKLVSIFLEKNFELCKDSVVDILNSIPKDNDMLIHVITSSEYECNLLPNSNNYILSSYICDLAIELLRLYDDKDVADFCCGTGTFFNNLFQTLAGHSSATGIEINEDMAVIAIIRATIHGEDCLAIAGDVFAIDETFDKIFANYPFNIKLNDFQSYLLSEYEKHFGFKINSSDWLFNLKIIESLRKEGRAVALCTKGSLCNLKDKDIRKHFIDNGWVECVISLPANVLNYTGINVDIIIFSFDNDEVSFIDAKNIYESHMYDEWEDMDRVLKISELEYTEIDGTSAVVNKCDILANSAILTPENYIHKDKVHNGVQLSSLCHSINRGSFASKKELSKYYTNINTGYKYLKMQDVEDGTISESLQFLQTLPSKYDKYCLRENDLVISKNGPKFKIARVERWHKTILASGNFYILRVNTDKVDPFYLQAYLESERGQRQLNLSSTGTSINVISISDLKSIQIPYPDIDERKKIADEYKDTKDRILKLRWEIDCEYKELDELFN